MTTVTSILKYLEMNSQNMDQNMDMHSRPKKRRLDHLTWEEKMQRKKLKNRVAAQTSRDRKKAKMEQMEHAVEQLFEQTEALREANERLARENADLLARLEAPCEECGERARQNRPVDCEALEGSTESLLLQKGRATQSAALLLKIALSCLLYKTCWTSCNQTSTSTPWSSSPTAFCKTSPEIWKTLLRKQTPRCSLECILLILQTNVTRKASTTEKWWGRHQRSWNPLGTTC